MSPSYHELERWMGMDNDSVERDIKALCDPVGLVYILHHQHLISSKLSANTSPCDSSPQLPS